MEEPHCFACLHTHFFVIPTLLLVLVFGCAPSAAVRTFPGGPSLRDTVLAVPLKARMASGTTVRFPNGCAIRNGVVIDLRSGWNRPERTRTIFTRNVISFERYEEPVDSALLLALAVLAAAGAYGVLWLLGHASPGG